MVAEQQLSRGIDQLGLIVSSGQQEQLLDYLALLGKWNKVYNLSAIRHPQEMISAHLLDSLALLPYIGSDRQRLLDVGSGAGLPGIPLAIAATDKSFVLLDSNGKKTRFLQQVKIDLGLANVEVVQQRLEDYRPGANFAIVTARAFTSLNTFFELCRPLLDPQGQLLAMKGRYPAAELEELPDDEVVDQVVPLQVPFLNAERHLIIAH